MRRTSPAEKADLHCHFHSSTMYFSLEEKYLLYGDKPARLGGESD